MKTNKVTTVIATLLLAATITACGSESDADTYTDAERCEAIDDNTSDDADDDLDESDLDGLIDMYEGTDVAEFDAVAAAAEDVDVDFLDTMAEAEDDDLSILGEPGFEQVLTLALAIDDAAGYCNGEEGFDIERLTEEERAFFE